MPVPAVRIALVERSTVPAPAVRKGLNKESAVPVPAVREAFRIGDIMPKVRKSMRRRNPETVPEIQMTPKEKREDVGNPGLFLVRGGMLEEAAEIKTRDKCRLQKMRAAKRENHGENQGQDAPCLLCPLHLQPDHRAQVIYLQQA